MARGRVVGVGIAGLALCALMGCDSSDGGGGAVGNRTPAYPTSTATLSSPTSTVRVSSPPVLAPAAQTVVNDLLPTAEGIAADIHRLYEHTNLTPADVEAQAVSLCKNQFSAFVTMGWMAMRVPQKNLLMLGPAHRLLDLASTPRICTRGPTPVERQQYRHQLFTFLANAPVRPSYLPAAPDAVQRNVCGFLQHQAGGQTVEMVLASIAKAVRSSADLDVFLPAAVEIAAQTCEQWLPLIRDVLAEHFSPN
ncbi:hypothetical protein Kfla_1914 [Kribbella flavida DSM 17836]|uniref:Uncharacterized protein n=1 Tax=Kribbella flavida (strain DSM 17836 / JCM 10339 / NBRC 14399) TaxID=479435 RepID=D2PPP6_KRIFD|nr:hypothetical protein [Kribbella flavida]ADB31008.1 hypothetical protein Kfla_1914 [Kribbella flavida DSM 17836]